MVLASLAMISLALWIVMVSFPPRPAPPPCLDEKGSPTLEFSLYHHDRNSLNSMAPERSASRIIIVVSSCALSKFTPTFFIISANWILSSAVSSPSRFSSNIRSRSFSHPIFPRI